MPEHIEQPTAPSTEAQLVHCVVCNQGSHRSDWQHKANPACDHHTDGEVRDALARIAKAKVLKPVDPGYGQPAPPAQPGHDLPKPPPRPGQDLPEPPEAKPKR